MRRPFVLILAVVFCALSSLAEVVPTPANYMIKLDGNWVDLVGITSRAVTRLKSEAKEFRADSFECSFWIDPDSEDKFIVITFLKRINQPGHRVYFSKDGKISGIWSGIMRG